MPNDAHSKVSKAGGVPVPYAHTHTMSSRAWPCFCVLVCIQLKRSIQVVFFIKHQVLDMKTLSSVLGVKWQDNKK